MREHARKKLIIFDLDGTLTESKTPVTAEMASVLRKLLSCRKVAVITGGSYEQMRVQLLRGIEAASDILENLHLFPTSGARFYVFRKGDWESVYEEVLTQEERMRISAAFERAFEEVKFVPPKILYGDLVEDRGTQMTFSAHGQHAPIELKKSWDPDQKKRIALADSLRRTLPDLEIRIAGTTSIDVTRKGIDKSYGIGQMERHLSVPKDEMLFFGDALFPDGNDYPVVRTGVATIPVTGPTHTESLLRELLRHV